MISNYYNLKFNNINSLHSKIIQPINLNTNLFIQPLKPKFIGNLSKISNNNLQIIIKFNKIKYNHLEKSIKTKCTKYKKQSTKLSINNSNP